MPDYREDINDWRKYVPDATGNVPITPTVATPSIPVVATPTPSGSGLSALYSRSNPYGGKGEMLASRAFRNTGNQRDYAAPVLAYLAGKKMKQSEEFTEKRNKDVDAYISRMEKSDQVRANKELLADQEKLFNKVGVPAIQKTYITEYRRAKDQGGDVNKAQEAASKAASTFANEWADKNGLVGVPFVEDMVLFQGGTAFRGREYDAKTKTFSNIATYKTIPSGQVMKDDGRGNWIPAENVFSLGEVLQHEQGEAAKAIRMGGSSGAKGKARAYYNEKGELVGDFSTTEEAYKYGGTHTKETTADESGAQTTQLTPTAVYSDRALSALKERELSAFSKDYGVGLRNGGLSSTDTKILNMLQDHRYNDDPYRAEALAKFLIVHPEYAKKIK